MTPRTIKLNAHRTLSYYTPEDVAALNDRLRVLQASYDQLLRDFNYVCNERKRLIDQLDALQADQDDDNA